MSKRPYTGDELAAVCADLDPRATATALVAGTKTLSDVIALKGITAQVKRRLTELDLAIEHEQFTRYGRTFVCVACNKEQAFDRKMGGHCLTFYSSFAAAPCPVEVCYTCAMANPTYCYQCKQGINYWEGGPVPSIPVYIETTVGDHYHRIELGPALVTLNDLKAAVLPKIPAGYAFVAIKVPGVARPTMNRKLSEIRADECIVVKTKHKPVAAKK